MNSMYSNQEPPCLHPGCYNHVSHPCELCGRMQGYPAYKVVEMFESIQGEGGQQGRWTLFVRFAECNLTCNFCDTEMDKWTYYSEASLLEAICQRQPSYVVFTGGEPCISPISNAFLCAIKERIHGVDIGLETNGTVPDKVFSSFDYVTVSPKNNTVKLGAIAQTYTRPVNEIRILVTEVGPLFNVCNALLYAKATAPELVTDEFLQTQVYLSPMFDSQGCRPKALKYIIHLLKTYQNPFLRLSLQIHKLLNLK